MGNSTITSVVLTLVIVFGSFMAIFLFMNDLANEQGVSYSNDDVQSAFNKINESQTELDSYVNNISDAGENITASQSDFFTWNTFKGLGAAVKLAFNFVGLGASTATAVTGPVEQFLPSWVLTLLIVIIIAIIVFILLAALTGGNSKI